MTATLTRAKRTSTTPVTFTCPFPYFRYSASFSRRAPGQGSMPSCGAVIGRQQPMQRARPSGMWGSLQEGQWPGAMIFSLNSSRSLAASSISAMLTGPNGIDSRSDALDWFIGPLLLLRRWHLYANERPAWPVVVGPCRVVPPWVFAHPGGVLLQSTTRIYPRLGHLHGGLIG